MAESKQKNVRLPADVTARLDMVSKRYGLEESDIVRRALRYYFRGLEKDKDILLSKEASEPLENTQPTT